MEDSKAVSNLCAFGSQIKALGDGRIGGYLVRFSGPKDPDLYGDFFTKDTDYGPHIKHEIGLYYSHGFDPMLKSRMVGMGTIKTDDVGLWFEAQLEARDEYEKFIADLVEQGKLSYSSGAIGNLVEREQKGNGTYWIKSWPIGEASLTPTPAEPRNSVMPVKAIADGLFIKAEEAQPEAGVAEEGNAHPSPTAVKAESASTHEREMEQDNKAPEPSAPEPQNTDSTGAPQFTGPTLDQIKGVITSELDAFKASQTDSQKQDVKVPYQVKGQAPAVMPKSGLGDSETKAFNAWMRGDDGAMKHAVVGMHGPREIVEIKASNATDMNIGTAADGGNTVTDAMHDRIMRRKDEKSLLGRLNPTIFTWTGTTLDIPIDNEADSEFVTTNEAATFDEDAPAIGQATLTKVKKTKYVDISYELLQDTSADVVPFVVDRVGIGYGKTLNDLMITEVETNGTEFKVFAGTGAIAVDELEDVALNNTNAFYVEDPDSADWVMAPATYTAIQKLDDANFRRYAENQQGSRQGRELLYSPVHLSNKCEAIGSGNKPVLFGDWSQVAVGLDPSLQFMRDPYSVSVSGQVRLLWYFRVDTAIIQAAGIGYGRNITT